VIFAGTPFAEGLGIVNDPTPSAPERALVHPVWWGALALLAFNDHVLKGSPLLPEAATGKLSDLAGLVVAPLLFATLVRARSRRAMLACHIAVGAVFAAIQVSPWAAGGWSDLMGLVGAPWVIVSDPTDLLTLPALLVSWSVLVPATRADASWARRGVERVAAVVGLFFCVATSAEDPCQRDPDACNQEEAPVCQDNDGDGVCFGADCDDNDFNVQTDGDGDGFCGVNDCDDTDPTVSQQCCIDQDGDGVCSSFDCNDQDPQIWDCCVDQDQDGFCADEDCDDLDPTVAETCVCSIQPLVIPVEGLTIDLSETPASEAPTCLEMEPLPSVTLAAEVAGTSTGLRWLTVRLVSEQPHSLVIARDCEVTDTPVCIDASLDSEVQSLIVPGGAPVYLHIAAVAPTATATLTYVDEPLVCGDGIQVGPEQCDDGNLEPGDGCDANCQTE